VNGQRPESKDFKTSFSLPTYPKSYDIDEVMALEHMVGIQKQLALEKAFSST
jgi:hypothetical protein